jgi:hypothetical protein
MTVATANRALIRAAIGSEDMLDDEGWRWLERNCEVHRSSSSGMPPYATPGRKSADSRVSLGEGGELWLRWQQRQASRRTTETASISAASILTEQPAPSVSVATTETGHELPAPPQPPDPQPPDPQPPEPQPPEPQPPEPQPPEPQSGPQWNPVQDDARYPDILTAAAWRRSRGIIAKAGGRTGMGAVLSQLQQAFHAVDWRKLRPVKPVPFNLPAWNKMFEEARSELDKIAAVHAMLQQVKQLADRTAAQFQASRVIPKSAREACEQIGHFSSEMQRSCSGAFLQAELDAAHKAGIRLLQETFDTLHADIPRKAQTCLAALAQVQSQAHWNDQRIMTLTRNITQFTGNAEKLAKAGFPVRVDVALCKTLTRQLTPYAQNEQPGMINAAPWQQHREQLKSILLSMRNFPAVG